MGNKKPVKISYMLYEKNKAVAGKTETRISQRRADAIKAASFRRIAPNGCVYWESEVRNGFTQKTWFIDENLPFLDLIP